VFQTKPNAHHVYVDDAPVILQSLLWQWRGHLLNAGVIEGKVQSAKRLCRFRERVADGGFVSYIADEIERFRAQLLDLLTRRRVLFPAPAQNCDVDSFFGEEQRGSEPDAGVSPSDENGFVIHDCDGTVLT
jgi:hypothetical protein